MKGARPVWLVEVTGNPPDTQAQPLWCTGRLGAPRPPHMAPPSGGGGTASAAAAPPHIWTCAAPRSGFVLHFRAARRREGWALRGTVQNQALQGGGRLGRGQWERKGPDCFTVTGCADRLLPNPRTAPASGCFLRRPAGRAASLRLPERDSGRAGRAVWFMDAPRARRPPSGPSFALGEGPRPPGDRSGISHRPRPLHPCTPALPRAHGQPPPPQTAALGAP